LKKKEADGHTTKHAKSKKTKHEDTKKHHTTVHHKPPEASGHHVTTKAKHSTHAKARSLSPGDAGCCTPEALAMSARLQGFRVSDGDVLDLLWLAGGDKDAGVPIAGALTAARRYGLGGVRPAWFGAVESQARGVEPPAVAGPLQVPLVTGARTPAATLARRRPADTASASLGTSLILGVELPGPHAVLATPDGWWSWGEPFDPSEWPGMVIEEAWAVEWVTAA